jgi:hypothetical protein
MDDPAHDPFLDFYADMGVDEDFYGRKVQAQIRPSTCIPSAELGYKRALS